MATKCSALKVTLKGEPEKVFKEVKKIAAQNDVIITGDAIKGSMKHKSIGITGTYTVKGQVVTVQMVDDTWLADCKKINKKVEEFFKGR